MAVDAVTALPGVQGMCADAKKRGAAGCVLGVDEAPAGACSSDAIAYVNRSCWWAVGLMEVMRYPGGEGDHANRVATFYVEPRKLQVVAASSFACGDLLFTLPSFRRRVMGTAKSTPDDPCPGAIPYPVAPSP